MIDTRPMPRALVAFASAFALVLAGCTDTKLRQALDTHGQTLSTLSGELESLNRSMPDLLSASKTDMEKLITFRQRVAQLQADLDSSSFTEVRNAHATAERVVAASISVLESSEVAHQAYSSSLELLDENHRDLVKALLAGSRSGAEIHGRVKDALQRIETLIGVGDEVTRFQSKVILDHEVLWLGLKKKMEAPGTSTDQQSQELAKTLENYLQIAGRDLEPARKTNASFEDISRKLREALRAQKDFETAIKE